MKQYFLALISVVLLAWGVYAQGAATPEEPQDLEEILMQSTSGGYAYDPAGRRDPFRSLLAPGNVEKVEECEGVGCLRIEEVKLFGIWKIKGEYIAQVQGGDEKPYWVKEGDSLLDGEVSRITPDAVYFKQKVNDPTRIQPYREVVRYVNPEEKP